MTCDEWEPSRTYFHCCSVIPSRLVTSSVTDVSLSWYAQSKCSNAFQSDCGYQQHDIKIFCLKLIRLEKLCLRWRWCIVVCVRGQMSLSNDKNSLIICSHTCFIFHKTFIISVAAFTKKTDHLKHKKNKKYTKLKRQNGSLQFGEGDSKIQTDLQWSHLHTF